MALPNITVSPAWAGVASAEVGHVWTGSWLDFGSISCYRLTATPNAGYRFVRFEWTDHDICTSYDADGTAYVSPEYTIRRVSSQNPYECSQNEPKCCEGTWGVYLNDGSGRKDYEYQLWVTDVVAVFEVDPDNPPGGGGGGGGDDPDEPEDPDDPTPPGPVTPKYTVTTVVSPVNGGSVTGGGTYDAGALCVLVATANAGWRFLRWRCDDGTVVSSSRYGFTVNRNQTWTAYFTQDTYYNVYTTPRHLRSAKLRGAGKYANGETATVSAEPSCSPWTFLYWIIRGTVYRMPTVSFTVNQDTYCVAYFEHSNSGLPYDEDGKILTDASGNIYRDE